jgi:hypothetical protein
MFPPEVAHPVDSGGQHVLQGNPMGSGQNGA